MYPLNFCRFVTDILTMCQGRRRFLKSGTAIERHMRSARAEGPSRGRAREGDFPPSLQAMASKLTVTKSNDSFRYRYLFTGFVLPNERCRNLKVVGLLGMGGVSMITDI